MAVYGVFAPSGEVLTFRATKRDADKAVSQLQEMNPGEKFAVRNLDRHTPVGNELRLSECAYGCKVYRCDECGSAHVFHNGTYGCPKGK